VNLLEANLSLLRLRFPEIAERIQSAEPDRNIRFVAAKSGDRIVLEQFGEREYPLHSTVDPARESERLLKTARESGFIVVYGLGAAWHLKGLLQQKNKELLLIIDGSGRLKSLFSAHDYKNLLEYPRLNLLLDPKPEELAGSILSTYLPGLHGGFVFIPLAALASRRKERYTRLQSAADTALVHVKNDFSVQAHFGRLWTRNCMANLAALTEFPVAGYSRFFAEAAGKNALLVGAGPSLRDSRTLIAERAADSLLIATDTALPFLQQLNLNPDLVVSIDSQYYTMLHAIEPGSFNLPWAVSPSAPPALLRRLKNPLIFAGGTPLELAIARDAGLPLMDTSGGNVLQAALSLTASAGIHKLTIFGADYAQPGGIPYAPATYVDHWFRSRSRRTEPFLSQCLSFTFEGRRETPLNEYDPQYSCRRLSRYREDMAEYLKNYPGEVDIHGVSAILLMQGDRTSGPCSRISKPRIPEGAPKPREVARNLGETIQKGGAEAVRLLYPLIAWIRNKQASTGIGETDFFKEARSMFFELSAMFHIYSGE
jgi:hypothetical protein